MSILLYRMECNCKNKTTFTQFKKDKREKKRKAKRFATSEEVIYIFEKVLEGWSTIKIFNTIVQNNPTTKIDKKHTENIATGNCKVSNSELPNDRFQHYNTLREQVYNYRTNQKLLT